MLVKSCSEALTDEKLGNYGPQSPKVARFRK